ncbi:hypothetical protein EDB84DRAFT_1440763 [Lactarius hengduanensis]|nr:hypothetical protein EDB84DRAFT_1440763 [Lactarius hengduanensis]
MSPSVKFAIFTEVTVLRGRLLGPEVGLSSKVTKRVTYSTWILSCCTIQGEAQIAQPLFGCPSRPSDDGARKREAFSVLCGDVKGSGKGTVIEEFSNPLAPTYLVVDRFYRHIRNYRVRIQVIISSITCFDELRRAPTTTFHLPSYNALPYLASTRGELHMLQFFRREVAGRVGYVALSEVFERLVQSGAAV